MYLTMYYFDFKQFLINISFMELNKDTNLDVVNLFLFFPSIAM